MQKAVLLANLSHKSILDMKTLLAIQLIHLAVKAAEHLVSVMHSIGHLIS
ncbi:MAG: hypothetical protein JWR09_5312 [Mucilaginibacter sp.]|jgi:hypothetical protein|nr:hypothetical protein [Mucilaginibacter sp.]